MNRLVEKLSWGSRCGHFNLKQTLEENIAQIELVDRETLIKGRMDILAATRPSVTKTAIPFWILLIESKNSGINALAGLPQLLVYAYKHLELQATGWGLTTNGMDYQFVRFTTGTPAHYQLLPKLTLLEPDSTQHLLRVLKAIATQA